MIEPRDRYRGALLGLATGDALGTTLEFRAPGSCNKIDDMVGGGPFYLAPGEWTDDTSMALCLAESLIETGRFDPIDQLERYIRWADHAHLSSNGTVFDIGNTVRKALANFRTSRSPHSGPSDEYSAGNGSLMRLAAIPLFFSNSPETSRSCGWPQFHFSFLVRRKPQSKSLERALAQLMERRLQSMPADIWALL